MPAQNYVLLERVEVGATAVSSITFNSIPQTGYTDLKIVVSGREVTGTSLLFTMQINGVATNQSTREVRGSGSTATSGTNTIATIDQNGSGTTASTFGNAEIYIPNYTSANYKSYSIDSVSENNATAAYMRLSAGLWSQNAAITSLSFFPSSGTIAQHSTFSLYALAALGTTPTKAPKATGGSIIQTDGTYWYHAFLASGTFTPAVGLSCDVLVVAGGGGGGGRDGGGGGAGGLVYTSSTSMTVSTNYTITVGGGAAGGSGSTSPFQGPQGSNSNITGGVLSLTAAVGGGFAAGRNTNAGSGGSGGGGSTAGTAGTGTSGQGFDGGAGGTVRSGGGGGAGAVGVSGTSTGNGGAGSNTYSSWASATSTGVSNYYAGGGGGGAEYANAAGAGGAGGGGAGNNQASAGTAGTANTGSGGGGGGHNGSGGAGGSGGSGIVIVRYLA